MKKLQPRWQEDEIRRARDLFSQGLNDTQIAMVFARSPESVRQMRHRHGITVSELAVAPVSPEIEEPELSPEELSCLLHTLDLRRMFKVKKDEPNIVGIRRYRARCEHDVDPGYVNPRWSVHPYAYDRSFTGSSAAACSD